MYAISSGIMTFTAWLTLRWWERSREPGSDNILLAIVYILSLSIGIHLGTFLVAPALFLFVLLVDWRRLLSGRELAAAIVMLGAMALFTVLQAVGSSLQASLAISLAAAALVAGAPVEAASPSQSRRVVRGALRDRRELPHLPPDPFAARPLHQRSRPVELERPLAGAHARSVQAGKPLRAARAVVVPDQPHVLALPRAAVRAGGLAGVRRALRAVVPGDARGALALAAGEEGVLLPLHALLLDRDLPHLLPELQGRRGPRARLLLRDVVPLLCHLDRDGGGGPGAAAARRGAARAPRGRRDAGGRRALEPSSSDPPVLPARPQPELGRLRLRAQHAGGPAEGFDPLHERRQRHVPALVHAGGRELPQGRPGGEPEPAQHHLVHAAAPRRRAARADRLGRRADRGREADRSLHGHDRPVRGSAARPGDRRDPHGQGPRGEAHHPAERLEAPGLPRGDGPGPDGAREAAADGGARLPHPSRSARRRW